MSTQTPPRPYAWDSVGEDVSGVETAEQAMKRGGLDWTVSLRPLGFQMETDKGNKTYKRMPGAFAIVRDTDGEVLGRCSKRYTPVQNHEAFAFVDALADSDGVEYGRVASLRGGKMIVLQAKLPEGVTLAGDLETELHVLFINHHTAGGAVKAAATPVVLACTNMLNLAVAKAARVWSTWHVGPLAGKTQDARETLEVTYEYGAGLRELSEELAKIKLTDKKARDLATALVPERPRSEKLVNQLMTTYKESPYNPNTGNGFGFVNAVGEFYEWEKEIRSDEARLVGDLVGFIRRQRDTAVELVKAAA